jgi:hypothetical protein
MLTSGFLIVVVAMKVEHECLWCKRTFMRRMSGGSPQLFCKERHRRIFCAALRAYAHLALFEGHITIEQVKQAWHIVGARRRNGKWMKF